MGQVTARISDELEADYNRWAAEEKLQRSDLVRRVLSEGAEARRERRAMFARPETLGPADLTWLAAKLDKHDTEMNRLSRQMGKRDAELARLTGEDSRVVSEARTAIVAGVAERVRAATELVTREVERTREAVLAAGEALPAKLAGTIADLPVFAEIGAALARIEEFARQPRKSFHLHIGGKDLSLRAAFAWLIFGSFVAVLLLLMLIKAVPSFGDRLEGGLLANGDGAICRMVNYRYHAHRCVVRQDGPTVTATATVRQIVP